MKQEIIQCKDSGTVISSEPWKPGQIVNFMWMPSGVHTIVAGFRKGSIELTVRCDESTVESVQASLDGWRAERPKQECFGCVEHAEREASFRIGASCGFNWNQDGVYLTAEPTTLGAQNVNGKIHRSWSPSFTTDAEYNKATESDGVLIFPEGARGSRSNPARITGCDFCVGTITNRPAFHAMSPVRAKDGKDADYNRTNGGNQATNEELAISFRNDVPDYTQAELLVYCNRIRKGGSHMEAVTEARATRNTGSAKANEKPTLESIFAKTRKATETANSIAESRGIVKLTAEDVYERFSVKATWSDAARKAALEARQQHLHKGFDDWVGMEHKTEPKHVAALADTLANNPEAHQAFFTYKKQGRGGSNMSDADASKVHQAVKDNSGDDAPTKEHLKGMHWASSMDSGIHHGLKAHVADLKNAFAAAHPEIDASDATPEAILERIYARAGASR